MRPERYWLSASRMKVVDVWIGGAMAFVVSSIQPSACAARVAGFIGRVVIAEPSEARPCVNSRARARARFPVSSKQAIGLVVGPCRRIRRAASRVDVALHTARKRPPMRRVREVGERNRLRREPFRFVETSGATESIRAIEAGSTAWRRHSRSPVRAAGSVHRRRRRRRGRRGALPHSRARARPRR